MYIRKFVRDDETIIINCYGFEIFKGDDLIREGCVENEEEDIQSILDIGFVEVEE